MRCAVLFHLDAQRHLWVSHTRAKDMPKLRFSLRALVLASSLSLSLSLFPVMCMRRPCTDNRSEPIASLTSVVGGLQGLPLSRRAFFSQALKISTVPLNKNFARKGKTPNLRGLLATLSLPAAL